MSKLTYEQRVQELQAAVDKTIASNSNEFLIDVAIGQLKFYQAMGKEAWEKQQAADEEEAILEAESREARLRALGFEEVTAEQRKANLATNVALHE